MVGRVRQEVAIHSRLKHPSVLELYTFFEDVNYVYLVLELCHNGELQRYLKNNVVILGEKEGKYALNRNCRMFINLKFSHSLYNCVVISLSSYCCIFSLIVSFSLTPSSSSSVIFAHN